MNSGSGKTHGRLSIASEIGLVFLCGAAAAMVAIATVANCLGQTGDSSSPGTKVSAVCTPAAGTAYYSLLAAAAAIAFIGVAAGHIRTSRRAATIGTWISLGLIVVCVISGFAIKVTPRTSYPAHSMQAEPTAQAARVRGASPRMRPGRRRPRDGEPTHP